MCFCWSTKILEFFAGIGICCPARVCVSLREFTEDVTGRICRFGKEWGIVQEGHECAKK
jgi:CxxC motif-containing protein